MSNVTGGQNWKSQSRQVLQNQYTASLSVFVPPWCWLQQCHLTCRTALDGFLCSYLDDDVSNAASPTSQNCTWFLSLFSPWCWCKPTLPHLQNCTSSFDVDAANVTSPHCSNALGDICSYFDVNDTALLPHLQNCTRWLSLLLPRCQCQQCCLACRAALDGFLCSYVDVDASNAVSPTELHLMALFVLTLMLMQATLPHPQNCTWWLFLAWCWCKQCYLAHRTAPDGLLCSYLDGDAGNVASPVELHLMTLLVHTLMSMPAILPRP